MSEHYSHKHQTTYECVDKEPEYITSNANSENKVHFYFVKAQCDQGLVCPPYDGNKPITCVVCTK